MAKKIIQHFDKIGQEIVPDIYVVYTKYNELKVGAVKKLAAVQVGVVPIPSEKTWSRGRALTYIYPANCVVVDQLLATMYVLKNS